MNPIDAITLTGIRPAASQAPLAQAPREVSAERATQFRELSSPAATPAPERIELDIEKVMLANLPAANASPAEFALGMLRAQVRVAQAAVAIELVNKTTQSLSQGVQSLATRS